MERVGPYALLEEIARGGMGVVYRARRGEREVALKLMLPAGAASSEELERFRREARVLAQLRHPGIVRVHDAGLDRGRPYLVMELLEGESLAARLRRVGRLEPEQTAQLGWRLALALEHAHAAGVVHRDLKPGNLFLTAREDPVLIDFGLARVAGAQLTATGDLLGTPLYMAPEQAMGEQRQIGPATDVYALGTVLYRCLTGEPPFRPPGGLEQVLHAILHQDPRPFGARCPQAPPGLEQVVLRCLAKRPADRFASAGALAEALAPYAGAGSGERAGRSPSRGRSLLAGLAALVGATGVGVWVATSRTSGPPSAPSPALAAESPSPPPLDLDAVRAQVEAMGPSEQAREGIALVDRLLQQDPGHAGAEGLRALLEVLFGRLAQAEVRIELALRRDPDQVDALLARANVFARDREPERALDLLDRLAERDIQRPWTRALMAQLWGALRQPERARRELEVILSRWRERAGVLEWVGDVATQFGWLEWALELLERAVALTPDRARVYFLRGTARNINGDPQSALRDFNRSIELGADESQTYVHRAIVHMDLGNDGEAFRDLEQAEGLDPANEQVAINRATLHARRGDYDQAQAELESALGLLSDDDRRAGVLRAQIQSLSTQQR